MMKSGTLIREAGVHPGCATSTTRIYLLSAFLVCLHSSALAEVFPCPSRCTCSGPFFVPFERVRAGGATNVDNVTKVLNVTKVPVTKVDDVTEESIPINKTVDNIINCSGLGLSKFPPDINSEVNILDLSYNGIDTLPTPRTLGTLRHLKQLLLHGNRIHNPVHPLAFQGLRSMVIIDLSHNTLISLPENVFESCESLKAVNLSWNKKISRLPLLITDSVKDLNVSYCGITNVSGTVLPSTLKYLCMKGNPLGILPDDKPLSSKTLEILDLRYCSLSSIQREALSRLPSLVKLQLSGNRQLVSISNVRSDSLRKLEAVDCGLGLEEEEDAPLAGMAHLTHAYLSGNGIKSLGPSSLTTNSLLVELDISRNGLQSIGPGAMHPLQNLHILNISRNHISALDYSVFAANHHLVLLDLSYNPDLSSLPSLVAYSLTQLDASHCGISEFGNGSNPLAGIPNLRLLDLCYNPLENLPIMGSQALKELDLAFCRLTFIKGSQISGLSQLKILILVGNRISFLDPKLVKGLSYLAISDNPWNCACKDPDFLKLWKMLERIEPQGQPLHCAPEGKVSSKENRVKIPGDGLRLWSDVCSRNVPVSPSRSASAMWSVFVALLLTLGGVIVAVVVFRHWSSRKRKEEDRRHAEEAERRIQRLRRRGRRSESDEEEGEERRRHRDVVTVRRRREEPRVSEPPPYDEALLMPRPEEVEVTLVTTPVDEQESPPPEPADGGEELVTQEGTPQNQEGRDGQEQRNEAGVEDTRLESPC